MCAAVCLLLLLYRKTYCDAAKDSSSILPVFRSSLQNIKKRSSRSFFLSLRSIGAVDGSHVLLYRERDEYVGNEQKKKQTGRKERAAHRVQLRKKGGLNRSTAARWLARK